MKAILHTCNAVNDFSKQNVGAIFSMQILHQMLLSRRPKVTVNNKAQAQDLSVNSVTHELGSQDVFNSCPPVSNRTVGLINALLMW